MILGKFLIDLERGILVISISYLRQKIKEEKRTGHPAVQVL